MLYRRLRRTTRPLVTALGLAYLLVLAVWWTVRTVWGDPWLPLFFLNSLAIYLFLPLPLVGALALIVRSRWLLLGSVAAVGLAALLYGGLVLPRPASAATGPQLTVLTYNLATSTGDDLNVLRTVPADVFGLQELSPAAAARIRADLGERYPYQVVDPRDGFSGMGIVSRYPLREVPVDLPGVWAGPPQVVEVDVPEIGPVRVFNLHALMPLAGIQDDPEWNVREREAALRRVAEAVAAAPAPVILLGDLNAGDQTAAYRVLSPHLRDAWHAAGSGPGHTWGGFFLPRQPRPLWVARIDYVLHSPALQTRAADVGPWDGVSDHLPVRAVLVVSPDG